ncbi:MAG: aldo/keto reductase [Candidatus Aminicenantes bacterium]|nr:aldo/keto reductase [Candidatus Aminicenantes bacterium]
MNFKEKITLGRTGLRAGRLGISSSFGAPARAYEEAFERGCNYFTWGTFIKGRNKAMREAIKNIDAKGLREDLIVSILSYAHSAYLTESSLVRGLKALGSGYADVLVLGYYSSPPPRRVLDGALKLKEKGLVRFIGITGHNRDIFPELRKEDLIDIFHVRYNAAHRGAEQDVFPYSGGENRPGVVTFTATRWGKLLDPKKMPPGEEPPTAVDCYRFVLSNPAVDVCMMGAKDAGQMRENLSLLETGVMNGEELERMRRIGDHVYGKKKK